MIVDHVSLPVRDLAVSAAFYDRVLATLGLQRRKERRGAIGWGPDAVLPPIFWALSATEESPGPGPGSADGRRRRRSLRQVYEQGHARPCLCRGQQAGTGDLS